MPFSRFDHVCMAEALRLAKKGEYTTHPNPRVGCVIARQEQMVGKGWHQVAGGPHAEIEALNDAPDDVEGATAYVTLEPCSHHGRTAPCIDALIKSRIARVVIAAGDPNPLVNGRGVELLRAAGIEVDGGLMAGQSEELNAGFFKRMRQGLPWVRVKSAISLDGRTALRNGDSMWISSDESRRDVQQWRGRAGAILTGVGTVVADNPRMTARLEGSHRQPLRVIADSQWRTPVTSQILSDPGNVLVAGRHDVSVPAPLKETGVTCIGLPTRNDRICLTELLRALAEKEVNEVQVEAGSVLCGAMLGDRLVDEILVYQAPILLGDGGPGPFAIGPLESMQDRTHLTVLETVSLGPDIRIRIRPE